MTDVGGTKAAMADRLAPWGFFVFALLGATASSLLGHSHGGMITPRDPCWAFGLLAVFCAGYWSRTDDRRVGS